jgi:hydrogenase nickel incorporation protein HypA/HybF
MHELSIAMGIVEVATEEAERRNARVTAVHLKIGQLSGVVAEALTSAFELAREATPLADAVLVIDLVPVAVFCPRCQAERAVSFPQMICPVCGSPTPEVVRGRELEVTALEIVPP